MLRTHKEKNTKKRHVQEETLYINTKFKIMLTLSL